MIKFNKLAGVPVNYDRGCDADYGTRGAPDTWRSTAEFRDKLDEFFKELWKVCPLGKAEVIATAGAFVDKPHSYHATGKAFDLDCIFWSNKAFVTKKYPTDKKFYLGVEAVLRKHFGQVLDWHYNEDHRDHFHIDTGEEVGFRIKSRTLIKFLQASLNDVFQQFVDIDGLYGDQTDGALRRVLQHLGIPGDLSNTKNWICFLDETAKEAFKTISGRVPMTAASSPLELLHEVYHVINQELVGNESRKTVEIALTRFAQHAEPKNG